MVLPAPLLTACTLPLCFFFHPFRAEPVLFPERRSIQLQRDLLYSVRHIMNERDTLRQENSYSHCLLSRVLLLSSASALSVVNDDVPVLRFAVQTANPRAGTSLWCSRPQDLLVPFPFTPLTRQGSRTALRPAEGCCLRRRDNPTDVDTRPKNQGATQGETQSDNEIATRGTNHRDSGLD